MLLVRRVARWLAAMCVIVSLVPTASVAAQTPGWSPGPGAVLDNTYDGFIDTPSAGATVPGSGSILVAGWFVDRTAQGWAGADDVQIFLGQMDGGGTMLAKALIAQSRPDVGAALGNPFYSASGFSAIVPASSVPAGNQTLSVYVHTPGKGWWYKQVSVVGGGSGTGTATPGAPAAAGSPPEVSIEEPRNEADVSTKSEFAIRGTARDPAVGPSGIDRIQVFINGEREEGTLLGETTPESDGTWVVTFQPTRFPSQHSNLYVYAHSRHTGKETVVARGINIVDR